MNKDPKKLSDVQDHVWNDPSVKAADGKTFCNLAWLKTCQGMGCHDFDPPINGEPYMADQLWYFFQRKENAEKFLEKNVEDVQNLANAGSLICAIAPSWILKEAHGHVVSITPGENVWSENLQKFVPVCLNVGSMAQSGRKVGLNWAFPLKHMMPLFFAWKELL